MRSAIRMPPSIRVLPTVLCLVFGLCLIDTGLPIMAHDFSGNTGSGGPPLEPDDCPSCCSPDPGGCEDGECFDGSDCGTSSGPVNFWDGREEHAVVDLTVDGYLPIQFARYYDSQTEYDSPLGYGWGHSYDMRILRYGDGNVVLRRESGRRREFESEGGGNFTSPPGENSTTLHENPDGTMTYLDADGTEYGFDANGRLAKIEDLFGNRLELLYDPGGRLPLQGKSKFSLDPDEYGIIALDYRLVTVRERDTLGSLTGRRIDLSYDTNTGRLEAVTDHTARTWSVAHDDQGNLSRVFAPENVVYDYAYEDPLDLHNLTFLDEGDQGFGLVYDDEDRVLQQTFVGGTVLDIEYRIDDSTAVTKTVRDDQGQTLRVATTQYYFSPNGNPEIIIDALGTTWEYPRDGDGRSLTAKVTEDGAVDSLRDTGFSRDATGNSDTVSILHGGETLTQEYTFDGNIAATARISIDSNPGVVHGFDRVFDYDDRGLPRAVLQEKRIVSNGDTDTPTFATLSFEYDDFGQLTKLTYPDGQFDSRGYSQGYQVSGNGRTFGRDLRGNLTSVTDENDDAWTFEYDDLDRLTVARDPLGVETVLNWQADRLANTERGKNEADPGRVEKLIYDSAGRLAEIRRVSSTGEVTIRKIFRDSDGFPIRTEDAEGRVVTYEYDLLDRLTDMTDAAGRTLSKTYDVFGNPTGVSDASGRSSSLTFRAMNNHGVPLIAADGAARNFDIRRDALGSVNEVEDPDGGIVSHQRDALGRTAVFTTAEGSATSFTYDGRTNIDSAARPGVGTTTYQYDPEGRLIVIDHPGTEFDATIQRDPAGRIERLADGDSDLRYSYDDRGRVTRETNHLTGRWVDTTFDRFDRRTGVASSDGIDVEYLYDESGHLERILKSGVPEATYIRDRSGLPVAITYGNGVRTGFKYDPGGRLASATSKDADGTVLLDVDYTRDLGGLVDTKQVRILEPSGSTLNRRYVYTYTSAARLQREEARDGTTDALLWARTFQYDALGNRQTVIHDGGPTSSYAYNPGSRLESITTGPEIANFAHSPRGELTSEQSSSGNYTFDYDPVGRLKRAEGPDGVLTIERSVDGRILAQTFDGDRTEFVYDGVNVLSEHGSSGVVRNLLGGAVDLVVSRQAGASNRYLLHDPLTRSTTLLLDETGLPVRAQWYRAFGEIDGSDGIESMPFHFGGRPEVPGTRLLDFRERAYRPDHGRFTTVDPLRLDMLRVVPYGGVAHFSLQSAGAQIVRRHPDAQIDLGGYTLAENRPVQYRDPMGQDSPSSVGAAPAYSTRSVVAADAAVDAGRGSSAQGAHCAGVGSTGGLAGSAKAQARRRCRDRLRARMIECFKAAAVSKYIIKWAPPPWPDLARPIGTSICILEYRAQARASCGCKSLACPIPKPAPIASASCQPRPPRTPQRPAGGWYDQDSFDDAFDSCVQRGDCDGFGGR